MSSNLVPIVTNDVATGRMVGRLYLPASTGVYPAIVVLGGSGGGLNWSAELAADLARRGFAAFALAYFGLPPLPKSLVNIELEYFAAAFDWLEQQDKVDTSRLALIGGSRGGELALQLGATFSRVALVVCYAPSSVRWGPVGGLATLGKPAWRWQERPLPQMPRPPFIRFTVELSKLAYSTVTSVPYHETPLFEQALEDDVAVSKSTIPVERIRGPILLISGSDDRLWPSVRMSEMIRERLKAESHPFAFKHLAYEGAGHAISLPDLPLEYYPSKARHVGTGITYALGGDPKINASASKEAWKEVLMFLEENTTP